MVNSAASIPFAELFRGENTTTPLKKTASGQDAFTQQLLCFLQESLERVGQRVESVQAMDRGVGSRPGDPNSSQRQFLVTLAAGSGVGPNEEVSLSPPVPEVMYSPHAGWNTQYFASEEMANWLAQRLGGEVEEFSFDCSLEFPPHPPHLVLRFGEKLINAGFLAMYFEPGRFACPDLHAAACLHWSGIINDYVRQNWSGLMGDAALRPA